MKVLVSGSPHFIEGKVIGIPRLTDDENNPTSTGEAQYEACLELIDEWEVKENICVSIQPVQIPGGTVKLVLD